MNRCLAFLLALVFAIVSVSSACVAAPSDWVQFTLQPERGDGKIHASFRDESRGRGENNWSTGFLPSELVGLDVASFRASGARPLRFAIVREAGRLDCSGSGGNSLATGNCNFTADPGFTQLLVGRGIGRRLFRCAAEHARATGARTLEWEAEPNALGFYEKMGARHLRAGTSEWGRTLSVMGAGAIVAEGKPAEVIARRDVRQLYFGEEGAA